MTTLHLMTQSGQPAGSTRQSCEKCGLMLVGRPSWFWRRHTYTNKPDDYRYWPAGAANVPDELAPCTPIAPAPGPTEGDSDA